MFITQKQRNSLEKNVPRKHMHTYMQTKTHTNVYTYKYISQSLGKKEELLKMVRDSRIECEAAKERAALV